MNFSKPSTVVGGGEMKRDTSSGVSIAKRDGASETSSSRSVTLLPVSTGSALRQSLVTVVVGLVVIGFIVALPFLSPLLGPGAAVAQIVGVLMGTQIATGALPVQYALPTLFAIDGQVGCDFFPVGLGLGEAKVETVEVGTPAVLFSRMITSPLAVVIAWAASFGL